MLSRITQGIDESTFAEFLGALALVSLSLLRRRVALWVGEAKAALHHEVTAHYVSQAILI